VSKDFKNYIEGLETPFLATIYHKNKLKTFFFVQHVDTTLMFMFLIIIIKHQ